MNWDTVEGNWKQLKGKAQAKWGKITDDEWDQIEGRREQLAGKIQERYGKSRDAAEREADEWIDDREAVLVVSHDLDNVVELCSRAVWLEKGVCRAEGVTQEVADALGKPSWGAARNAVVRALGRLVEERGPKEE